MSKPSAFQKRHGSKLAAIFGDESYQAAGAQVCMDKLDHIMQLTDSDIRENSVVILADLRGFLLREFTMNQLVNTPLPSLPNLEVHYANPAQEAFDQSNPKKK